MVKIKWAYLAEHANNPPEIEIACTEAELAEAMTLDPQRFQYWVSEITSGVSHSEAMAWAMEV